MRHNERADTGTSPGKLRLVGEEGTKVAALVCLQATVGILAAKTDLRGAAEPCGESAGRPARC